MIFRVSYMATDMTPHVYCRVFCSPAPGKTFVNLGSLTMRRPEFEALRQTFNAEFKDETPRPEEA